MTETTTQLRDRSEMGPILESIIVDSMKRKAEEAEPVESIAALSEQVSPAFIGSITLLKQSLTNDQIAQYLPKMKDEKDLGAILLLDYLHAHTGADKQKEVWANVSMLLEKGEKPMQEVLRYAVMELGNKMPKDERKKMLETMNKISVEIKKDYAALNDDAFEKKVSQKLPFVDDIISIEKAEEQKKKEALEERLRNDKFYAGTKIAGRVLKNAAKDFGYNSVLYPAILFSGILPSKLRDTIYDKLQMASEQQDLAYGLGFLNEFLALGGITTYLALQRHANGNDMGATIAIGSLASVCFPLVRLLINDTDNEVHGSLITTIPYYLGKGIYEAGKAVFYKAPKHFFSYFKRSIDKAKEETFQELLRKDDSDYVKEKKATTKK